MGITRTRNHTREINPDIIRTIFADFLLNFINIGNIVNSTVKFSLKTNVSSFWWNVFSIDGSTGNIENINEISYSGPGEYKGAAEQDVKKGK